MGSLGERSILVFQLSICFQIKKKDYLKETTMESQHGDAENPNQAFVFSEKSIRLGFIRKVYSILMLQLVITFGIMSIFVFINDVSNIQWIIPRFTTVLWESISDLP